MQAAAPNLVQEAGPDLVYESIFRFLSSPVATDLLTAGVTGKIYHVMISSFEKKHLDALMPGLDANFLKSPTIGRDTTVLLDNPYAPRTIKKRGIFHKRPKRSSALYSVAPKDWYARLDSCASDSFIKQGSLQANRGSNPADEVGAYIQQSFSFKRASKLLGYT